MNRSLYGSIVTISFFSSFIFDSLLLILILILWWSIYNYYRWIKVQFIFIDRIFSTSFRFIHTFPLEMLVIVSHFTLEFLLLNWLTLNVNLFFFLFSSFSFFYLYFYTSHESSNSKCEWMNEWKWNCDLLDTQLWHWPIVLLFFLDLFSVNPIVTLLNTSAFATEAAVESVDVNEEEEDEEENHLFLPLLLLIYVLEGGGTRILLISKLK